MLKLLLSYINKLLNKPADSADDYDDWYPDNTI